MIDPDLIALRRAWPTDGTPEAGTDAIDTLTFVDIISGSFALKVGSRITAPITWSAVNNTLRDRVDAALEALPNVGTGGIATAVGTMTAGIGTLTTTWGGKHAKERGAPAISLADVKNSLAGYAGVAQKETATIVGTITPGVAQVETATIVGTIVDAGNAKVVVTCAGMDTSPRTVTFAVAALDNASAVAGKARAALAADVRVAAFFNVTGATDKVILTAKSKAANDATLNIASDNDSCTGLTPEASSADTTAGVAPGIGKAKITVTAAGMNNSPKDVGVTVAAGDNASAVATKARAALARDDDVRAFFAVSGATDKIILTALAPAANDATMNIASTNDTCTGLTPQANSADTTAGIAPGPGPDVTVERTTPGVDAARRFSPAGSYLVDLGAGAVYQTAVSQPAVWSLID